ncbi:MULTISPECIES: hypothetical protein [Sphingobacterium]|uniref:Beta-lactamase-inhibitor-like PepSY-like domain-containing protein n=1 Tax=Sphingobacterium ginsenosidimutans TaxID=687845 RepID=A0ABP8ABG9_9SPHI|nr:hypothetical protein [Sphingobacterium sp. E70]ULT25980.1 hypothetical protein KUH03_03110 [Sphingobacterium sp. E70]
MMIKTLTLNMFFLLLTMSVFSQNHAGIKSLLNKDSEFIFPQTVQKIEAALNAKTVYYEDANEEKYAKWLTNSGLELYTSLGKGNTINEIFFDIPEDQALVVEGLPFNLVMNKTTLKESAAKFSKYAAKTQKMEEGSTFPGGSKLTFKKGKHYATLIFDNKNLLRFLGLTTELIGPGVN